jgi:hypothetical protein
MAISKTIHYCWFGNGAKPELLQQCIASWKQNCPDYEIIEWNETNFDVNFCNFTKQAYEAKKYAFVSDVARLWIVYHYGGHYLDTDVELKQSLDAFADYDGWFASETIRFINTGLGFGAQKHSPMVKCMLDYYLDQPFNDQVCVNVNTASLREQYPDLDYFNDNQVYQNVLFVGYPNYGKYARHYYTATWKDAKSQKKRMKEIDKIRNNKDHFGAFKWKLAQKIRRPKLVNYLETHPNFFTKVLYFMIFDLYDCGLWLYIKLAFRRIFRIITGNRSSSAK